LRLNPEISNDEAKYLTKPLDATTLHIVLCNQLLGGYYLMRFKYLYLTATLLLTCFLIGCNSAENRVTASAQNTDKKTPSQTTYSDGARRITITELQDLIKKGDAFIIDVRNQASFDSGHIPGAKLIPATEILNHLDELPKDKTIVTYCS
jgi:hypothetical protein